LVFWHEYDYLLMHHAHCTKSRTQEYWRSKARPAVVAV